MNAPAPSPQPSPRSPQPAPRSRSLLMMLPAITFLGIASMFLISLWTADPSRLPSTLIGKPAPQFSLPPLPAATGGEAALPGLATADLAKGRVTVVNFWASWCLPCHQEHPHLVTLAKRPDVTVVGINYKDRAEEARRFLGRYGNPYKAIGVDQNGRAAIEWGVYGMPETFVVDGKGTIVFKYVGPISESVLERQIVPAIRKAAGT